MNRHIHQTTFDMFRSLVAPVRSTIALILIALSLGFAGSVSANDEAKLFNTDVVGETTGTFFVDPLIDEDYDNEVMFNVHGCPAGYDVVNVNYYDAVAGCNNPIEPITFHLYDNYGEHIGTTDWLYTWSGVGSGKIFIEEEIPVNHKRPFAFCHVDDGAWFQAPLSNGGLTQEIGYGQFFYCDWFVTPKPALPYDENVFDSELEVAADVSVPTNSGAQVGINTFVCKSTSAESDLSHGALIEVCQPLTGAEVNIYNDSGPVANDVTDGNGIAQFPSLSPGIVTIESLDRAFDDRPTVVYCNFVIYGDGYVAHGVDTLVDSAGNEIQQELVDGMSLGCDWFYPIGISNDGGQDHLNDVSVDLSDGVYLDDSSDDDSSEVDDWGVDEVASPAVADSVEDSDEDEEPVLIISRESD